jgi:Antidote-toxin recognition MazE, bacterial antitoxin
MKRSLVQAGSSLAVTLPAEVVQSFGLKKGQEVDVSVHPLTGTITIRPGVVWLEGGEVGPTFRALVDDVLGRRAALARKVSR